MQLARLVLEYLRVFLSPAPVASVVVLVFVLCFRAEVRALIDRIATIRFPGGEVSTTQLEQSLQEPDVSAPPQPPPDPAHLLDLPADQQQRLRESIEAERERARLWEYRFLNYYLVPHTQLVLDWLVSRRQRTTAQLFDSFWMHLIPDPRERSAVLSALRTHHLIDLQGDLLEVTHKGREYIAWRSPLSQLLANKPLQPTSDPSTNSGTRGRETARG